MADHEPKRRLWLLRHGESTWNVLGLVQGQTDIPSLTPRGQAQAEAAGRVLSCEPIGAVYASDLARSAQTASRVADALGLPVVYDDRLRERNLGVAEGLPISSLSPVDSGIQEGSVVDPDAAPLGGESVRDLYRRARNVIEMLMQSSLNGDVLLVTHGGIVRVVTAWLDGIAPEHMGWMHVTNASPLVRWLPDLGAGSTQDSPSPTFQEKELQ